MYIFEQDNFYWVLVQEKIITFFYSYGDAAAWLAQGVSI